MALFVAGNIAFDFHKKSNLGREGAIIEHLVTWVGEELAEQARDVLEVNYVEWTKENYINGAPTSAMGPGKLRKYGSKFRKPYLNIIPEHPFWRCI